MKVEKFPGVTLIILFVSVFSLLDLTFVIIFIVKDNKCNFEQLYMSGTGLSRVKSNSIHMISTAIHFFIYFFFIQCQIQE